ncbi:MAG: histidinol-phosphatase [Muribaculaceae bacterium]|nr:histidinol-phosphatase [Muribaculaceae bacterium]
MIKDILVDIGDSRKYTLHSHTEFCDGRATMEAFARKVVESGFTHYGFSPHSPIPIMSPCNMTREKVAVYDEEFNRICDQYGDRVKFYRSMEIDYLGEEWGPSHKYFSRLNLDYAIGSVHFIPNQEGEYIDIDGNFEGFKKKMVKYFNNDIRYVVETFYQQSCKMVEAGGFEIIGHLDKIGCNAGYYQPGIESESWYQSLLNDLIDRVIDSGVVVEINTKAWQQHQKMYPHVEKWCRLIQSGVKIVVNSDAHVPALINAGREEAYAMLDRIKAVDKQ